MLANLESLRTLFIAVAAKVATLDEADCSVIADLNVEASVLDCTNHHGDRLAFLDAANRRSGSSTASAAAFKLLHAKRNTFLHDIHVENLGLDRLALAVELQCLL